MRDKQLCDRLKVTRYPFGLYLTNMGFYARRADVVMPWLIIRVGAITLTNAVIHWSPLGTNFNESWIEIKVFSSRKIHLKCRKNVCRLANTAMSATQSKYGRCKSCQVMICMTQTLDRTLNHSAYTVNETETLPPSPIADKFNTMQVSRKRWQRDFCDTHKNTPLGTNIVAAHWRLRAR